MSRSETVRAATLCSRITPAVSPRAARVALAGLMLTTSCSATPPAQMPTAPETTAAHHVALPQIAARSCCRGDLTLMGRAALFAGAPAEISQSAKLQWSPGLGCTARLEASVAVTDRVTVERIRLADQTIVLPTPLKLTRLAVDGVSIVGLPSESLSVTVRDERGLAIGGLRVVVLEPVPAGSISTDHARTPIMSAQTDAHGVAKLPAMPLCPVSGGHLAVGVQLDPSSAFTPAPERRWPDDRGAFAFSLSRRSYTRPVELLEQRSGQASPTWGPAQDIAVRLSARSGTPSFTIPGVPQATFKHGQTVVLTAMATPGLGRKVRPEIVSVTVDGQARELIDGTLLWDPPSGERTLIEVKTRDACAPTEEKIVVSVARRCDGEPLLPTRLGVGWTTGVSRLITFNEAANEAANETANETAVTASVPVDQCDHVEPRRFSIGDGDVLYKVGHVAEVDHTLDLTAQRMSPRVYVVFDVSVPMNPHLDALRVEARRMFKSPAGVKLPFAGRKLAYGMLARLRGDLQDGRPVGKIGLAPFESWWVEQMGEFVALDEPTNPSLLLTEKILRDRFLAAPVGAGLRHRVVLVGADASLYRPSTLTEAVGSLPPSIEIDVLVVGGAAGCPKAQIEADVRVMGAWRFRCVAIDQLGSALARQFNEVCP